MRLRHQQGEALTPIRLKCGAHDPPAEEDLRCGAAVGLPHIVRWESLTKRDSDAIPGVSREDLDGDTHGGIIETSQLLALHGDGVDPGFASLPRQTVDTWLVERGERRTEVGHGDPRRQLALLRTYRKALAGRFASSSSTR